MSYKEEAARLLDRAKNEPINILIWGPGKPGRKASARQKKAYQKRQEIKKVLSREFPQADVYFSEDKELQDITVGIKGQLLKEAVHAKVSDLVLILDVSRGADLELDHFVSKYPWFRNKIYVLVPEQYVSTKGLVKEIYNLLTPDQIVGYTDKEFKDCSVARVKSVDIAQTVAVARMLEG